MQDNSFYFTLKPEKIKLSLENKYKMTSVQASILTQKIMGKKDHEIKASNGISHSLIKKYIREFRLRHTPKNVCPSSVPYWQFLSKEDIC